MRGVLRVLSVEPPEDIVNTPKNTVATVKNIAAMMTTTNRSIVRLPEQFLPAPRWILARVFRAPPAVKLSAAVHTKRPLGANPEEKPICCVAISLGGGIDAHLLTQVHIFQRNSACATLKTFVALRNKSKQCRKSVW
jgi:hypothetical protein